MGAMDCAHLVGPSALCENVEVNRGPRAPLVGLQTESTRTSRSIGAMNNAENRRVALWCRGQYGAGGRYDDHGHRHSKSQDDGRKWNIFSVFPQGGCAMKRSLNSLQRVDTTEKWRGCCCFFSF